VRDLRGGNSTGHFQPAAKTWAAQKRQKQRIGDFMADEAQGLQPDEGQANIEPKGALDDGTPKTAKEQPQGDQGATPKGHADEVVFDPAEFESLTKELPDNVKRQAEALRKSLQAAFTKKTQAIAENRKKIEAYEAFERDPHSTVAQIAQQLGYKLTPAQQRAAEKASEGEGWSPEKGDPKSWDDVVGYVTAKMQREFSGKLQPIVQEFQSLKKQTIESQLSEIDPSWAQYEDAMSSNLQKHPTLAQDPATLYRISVPSDVLESRATQRALARLESKTKSAQVGGASTTRRTPEIPDGPISFAQAVELARAQLDKEGVKPG
jgi:hypothetical protein